MWFRVKLWPSLSTEIIQEKLLFKLVPKCITTQSMHKITNAHELKKKKSNKKPHKPHLVWLCRDVVSLCHNLFPKESAFITISPSSFTRPVINIFMAPWVFRHHIVPHHILLTVWGFKDCAFIREDLQMYKKWKQCTTSQDSAGHCNKDKKQIKKQKTTGNKMAHCTCGSHHSSRKVGYFLPSSFPGA